MYRCFLRAFLLVATGLFQSFAASAQTTNFLVDQFDSNTAASYVNQHWGTAVPVITWDSAQNAISSVGSNYIGSGSAKWVVPWTTTGDQIEVTPCIQRRRSVKSRQLHECEL